MGGSDGIDRRAFLKGTGGLLWPPAWTRARMRGFLGPMTGFVWGS
jgi:hypothetical protein